MKKPNSLKTIALSLGLAAMLMPAKAVVAQDRPGGLFGTNASTEGSAGPLMGNRSGSSTSFNIGTGQFGGDGGSTGGNYGITIGTMGEEPPTSPLGSGLFIMAAAGAAYAFSKKRKKQENN